MTSTVEMLEKLVAFDTTSSKSNLDLMDYVQGFLDVPGVSVRRVTDPSGRKAALQAVIGDPGGGGLAFSGHVDTVPVEGQAWNGDPFALRTAGDRLVGRGAVDMKGFVASCLAAVPDLVAMRLPRPIHLLISYDEEVDASGARRLVEDLRPGFWKPDACIVGEPTQLAPVVAHKGKLVVRGAVRGLPGHSSQPAFGVNAVHASAETIAWAVGLSRRHADHGPFAPGFDPPYSTVHVGLTWGGSIVNIIPEDAGFVMEWRTIPGDDALAELEEMRRFVADHIEPAMKAVSADTGVSLVAESWYPELVIDPAHPLVRLVGDAAGKHGVEKVSYATEAGVFQAAGISTVVCGPGSIAQAHKPDEWIARSELDGCDRFVREMAQRFCASGATWTSGS